MVKSMWMVRAGEGAFLIDDFVSKNYVSIGWNEIGDISQIKQKEKIKKLVEISNLYKKKGQISKAASQISRFLLEFKKEDYVITFDPNKRVYYVGEILSEYEYNPQKSEYYHVRNVKWLGKVDRDDLSVQTKNSIGAISTIFKVNDSAKKEILDVLEGKKKAKDQLSDELEEQELKEDMVHTAHELIKDKLMKLDWDQMQDLVAGVLRSIGYKTRVVTKGPDRGKDIEASPDGLMLKQPSVLAQIKHQENTQIGASEIRNFHSILRGTKKGIYVSTGGFSREAKYEAERSNEQLTLVDADMLVEFIVQNYDNFDIETRQLIPLVKIYWPT